MCPFEGEAFGEANSPAVVPVLRESDAMFTLESRRDYCDVLNKEFRSDVDALVSSAHAEEEARRSARRNEAEDKLDDRYDGQSDDLHTGLGY